MKTKLVLLGMIASVVVPFSARADSESFRTGDNLNTKKAKSAKTVTRAHSHRVISYITSKSVTGSHIPLVVARYDGQYYSNSPLSVYGRPDLDRTGQLSVQGELYQSEPAISSVGIHH